MKPRVLGTVCLALGLSLVPVAASGRPVDGGRFVVPYNLQFENFCEVPGLTISDVGTATGRYLIKTEGRSELTQFQGHTTEAGTVTNLANGYHVSYRATINGKDLKILDNHDGTITIISFQTGPSTTYDAAGRALVRNPGQYRERVVIDLNGTLDDESDDQLVSLEVLKQSTGRTDDYCGPVLAALGVQ